MNNFIRTGVISAAFLLGTVTSQAALTLTPAGVSAGFSLSTFGTDPSNNYFFLAAAVLSDGKLAVINNRFGVSKFNDVDGQTPATSLGFQSLANAQNIANVGGKTYASQVQGGLYEVSSSLALTPVPITTPGVLTAYGLAGNPVTGHLLASVFDSNVGRYGLADIDPITGSATIITYVAPNVPANLNFFDGVSVSPDGQIVYAADFAGGSILGFNIASHAQVFDSGLVPGRPDGAGIISGTALDGNLVVFTNSAGLIMINPNTLVQTVIATGSVRGDFTSPDSNDGSLLLADSNAMYRLKIEGGTIGAVGAVPEPASMAIWGLGVFGCAVAGYRRRQLS